MGSAYAAYARPEITPTVDTKPTFDPLVGFPAKRKERVMKVTQEELESAKIPLEDRDYCAHLLIDYRNCRSDVWPLAYKCAHEKHAYLNCQYDDYVLRMKEYERERRLRVKAQKEIHG